MTENEKTISVLKHTKNIVNGHIEEALDIAIQALEEIKQYRAIGTVEEIQKKMEELERWHTDRINENIKNPFAYTSTSICHNCDHKDEYIEELEAENAEYKSIGTIEELKALKEKFENAKDDIRKLLSSKYGSSCQFCVHDENEDAMCCNIGGSGSWCCENARWKEH